MSDNKFGCRRDFDTGSGKASYYSLEALEQKIGGNIGRLPFSIGFCWNRHCGTMMISRFLKSMSNTLANWDGSVSDKEIPHKPTRVILQDFTGVPAVVDLASLRSAMAEMGGDPEVINPRVPVDLVIDHSVQVDHFGGTDSLDRNMEIEFERNQERYEFLKWGQNAFRQFRAFPPGVGIVHQVNLEYVANVVQLVDGVAFPDTLVGTDSHTTMINGLGVMGWGVGGIEAESVMLGQPIHADASSGGLQADWTTACWSNRNRPCLASR